MGGPFEIGIVSGGNALRLRNVYVGLMASSCHNNALDTVAVRQKRPRKTPKEP
jgi:hypothetical protein